MDALRTARAAFGANKKAARVGGLGDALGAA